MKCSRILLAVWLTALLVDRGVAHAAEITVLTDRQLQPALKPIGESFRRDSGHDVKFVYVPPTAIHRMVAEAQTADVVITQYIDELVKAGKVAAGEHPVIARVGIGVFTRPKATAPDISTAQALKQALLSADTIALGNEAAGNYFATVLERLGIADAVKDKIVVLAKPVDVVSRVSLGKGKDLGVFMLPLILGDKRLNLVGPLPAELQSYVVYTAASTANPSSPEAAKQFIQFLTLPQAKKEFAAVGAN